MGKRNRNLVLSAAAAICLSCCIWGTILPVNATTEEPAVKTGSAVLEENITMEGSEIQAPEELFEEYIEQFLYEEVEHQVSMGNVGGQRIKTKEEKAFYEEMKVKIKEIATGKRKSTVVNLDMKMKWTASELGVSKITSENVEYILGVMMKSNFSFGNMISYLLMDCPYELYWFDKTVGTSLYYNYSYTGKELVVYDFEIHMPVVPAYQATSGSASQKLYTLNTSAVNTVEKAKNKAMEIVAQTAHLSKYERLVAFKDTICELTEYYDEAAEDPNMDYGNPWQMIWVFDGNPSTNVVCEGYSKAFQYLCDLSGLTCYTVCGMMGSSGGGGPHMWNVVKFAGVNYLVDITNCDYGTIGYPDKLFMAGTGGSVAKGYQFPQYRNLTYTYDDDQDDLIGWSNLNLSSSNFDTSQISSLSLSFAQTQRTVPYRKGTPDIPALSVKKNGSNVSDAKIRYLYRKNGSNAAFKEGLPNELGTFQVKAVANGDFYWTSESSNMLLLTIEESVAWIFKDIQGYEWHFDYVQSAYDKNLMTGISGTNLFQPDTNITKAQVAQVLYNMEGKPWASDITVFYVLEDVYESEWYADAVAWAYDAGIITGDLYTKKFSPNASVTREQLALMIYRYADYKGYDVSQTSDLEGLKNNWKVNTYAETAVKWAVGTNLIGGIEIKNSAGVVTARDLAPQGTASRAQVATILTRFCEANDIIRTDVR